MPELPEVESLRLSLLPHVINRKITDVKVILPKLVSGKGTKREIEKGKVGEFETELRNRSILKLRRRAKNLIFSLDNGSLLLVHLKMTGQLVFQPANNLTANSEIRSNPAGNLVLGGHPIRESEINLPHKHTYVIFTLDNGTLYYNDVRQFGYLLYYRDLQVFEKDKHFENLGLEPLSEEFSPENFKENLRNKSGNLKNVLLSQSVVVGLGNIYADEVCFLAKIRPTRSVKSLSDAEISALYSAITEILSKAVALGGSSVANYILADGSRGNFAREHKVYGRGGKHCLVCGRNLEKEQVAGRTTIYCNHCQK